MIYRENHGGENERQKKQAFHFSKCLPLGGGKIACCNATSKCS
jgi:hypothetical protein